MSGYTKHVYEEDLQETKKQLVKYVDDIIPLLSEEYDFDEILKLVKKYYPFEWRMLEEKYQYYCKKDKTIMYKELEKIGMIATVWQIYSDDKLKLRCKQIS